MPILFVVGGSQSGRATSSTDDVVGQSVVNTMERFIGKEQS